MRRLGPNDGPVIPPGDHEEALADGRRAVIAGPEFPPVDAVAAGTELSDERAEPLPLCSLNDAASVVERTPFRELLHVFEENDARRPVSQFGNPAIHQHHRQLTPPDIARRCAALGLGVVRAVRRHPEESDAPAARHPLRREGIHVLHMVFGFGMVPGMKADGHRIMVDGGMDMDARHFKPAGRAASAREHVHNDFLRLSAERVFQHVHLFKQMVRKKATHISVSRLSFGVIRRLRMVLHPARCRHTCAVGMVCPLP